MLVSKICLTGGPCGGKTTALNVLGDTFQKHGIKVIIINETATELIKNEQITGKETDEEFAEKIIERQLEKEAQAIEHANSSDNKYVIVCDRSAIEPSAYVGIEKVGSILKKHNTSFEEIRDSYDLVIHLTTAAKGASKFYTLENNEARKESIEEAVKIDENILRIWNGHKNRAVIENKAGFDKKMEAVLTCLKNEERLWNNPKDSNKIKELSNNNER